MLKFIRAVLCMLAGFFTGVVACVILILLLSANTHDRSIEMAMTAASAGGPIGAIVGLIGGLAWKK